MAEVLLAGHTRNRLSAFSICFNAARFLLHLSPWRVPHMRTLFSPPSRRPPHLLDPTRRYSEPLLMTSGGLVNLDLLNIGSDNAGDGGSANSGNSAGGRGGCGAGKGGDAYTGMSSFIPFSP